MSNNNFSRICNTALLRTGFIDSKNINAAYERLFLTLIEFKKYEEVDLSTLSDDFNSFYNAKINTIFSKNFALRLERKHYLKRIEKDRYLCKQDLIKELGLLAQYIKLENDSEFLINDLISFLKAFGETNVSKEKAINYLTNSIENSVSNLGQNKFDLKSEKDRYLMYLYLNKIKAEKNSLFEIYKNIMYGRILSTFIDGNERYLSANSEFFRNTTFYLDSGFVFNLLGLNSNKNGSEYEDMIRVLQRLGANIKVFDHIFHDEIENIIFTSISYVENPLYKPSKSPNVTNYFVQNGYTKVEVEEYYHSLEKKLNGYGITIESFEINYNEDDNAFEKNFYDMIVEDYRSSGKMDEDRIRTYWNDAKSLYLVHKLRKGKTYTKLSDTMHVLLTTNSGIGRVANDFNAKTYNGNNTPYALTDLSLNTLIYISYGNYSEHTNERFAIPAAFHGFDPSKEWLVELDKQLDSSKEKGILSEKEIVSWKSSKFLLNELVKTTKGNPELFDDNTIEKTLKQYKADADKMVDDIDKEARQKIEDVQKRLQAERGNNIRLKDKIIDNLEALIDSLNKRKNELIDETHSNESAIKKKKIFGYAVITFLAVVLTASIAFLYILLSSDQHAAISKQWITAIVFVAVTLLTNMLWKIITQKNEESVIIKLVCKTNVSRIESIKKEILNIEEKIKETEEQIFALKNGTIS